MAQTKSDLREGSIRVRVDMEKLRGAIVQKYSLTTMSKIIGKNGNYFALSSAREASGIKMDDLETICLVLGKDISDFIKPKEEEELQSNTEQPDAGTAEKAVNATVESQNSEKAILGQLITIDQSIQMHRSLTNKIYEGIELNGAGIGELVKAVNSNTDAINKLTKEVLKIGTSVTSWAQKWRNQKEYGRF